MGANTTDIGVGTGCGGQFANGAILFLQDVDDGVSQPLGPRGIVLGMVGIRQIPEHMAGAMRFLETDGEQVPILRSEEVQSGGAFCATERNKLTRMV